MYGTEARHPISCSFKGVYLISASDAIDWGQSQFFFDTTRHSVYYIDNIKNARTRLNGKRDYGTERRIR